MAGKSKRKKLSDQLISLLDDIGEEGLLFLIKQANTIIYNQKVDELNRQSEELENSKPKSAGKKQPRGKTKEAKAKTASGYEVAVERGAFGTSYIMALENARKTFAEQELLQLVRVCHAAADKADGSSRVFTWLKRNRDDVLLDAGITSARHPAMPAIYTLLRSNFSLRT